MKFVKLFILSLLFAYCSNNVFSQKDSVVMKNIRLTADTTIYGVRGIGISYNASLYYDSVFHQQKKPTALKLIVSLHVNGTPVKCENTPSKYCINGFFLYKKDLFIDLNKRKTLLIPFYTLKLPQGKNSVTVSLSAIMSDTSIFESTFKNVKLVGETKHRLTFIKPPVEKFNVLVSGVKLMSTDFKGKSWDYNLVSGSAPDICWKVTMGSGDFYNTLYRSSVTKNSYSAAWLDGTNNIILSEGDVFCIGIYDDDPMSDDLAGSLCGNLSKILDFSTKKQPMSFDRLSYFSFMIHRVAP